MNNFSILIKNGTIIDGTGKKRYLSNLIIDEDKIVSIYSPNQEEIVINNKKLLIKNLKFNKEIDARSMVVAPGFIDVHTHDDQNIFDDPTMSCKISQGVTSCIVGNCGISLAPFNFSGDVPAPIPLLGEKEVFKYPKVSDYKSAFLKSPSSINVALLTGHSMLRVQAMNGDFARSANNNEISAMQKMLDEALKEGSIGLSTGLAYPAASAAPTDEIIELAKVLKAYDGIFTTHMRNEGDDLLKSVKETIEIGKVSGARTIISHHKCAGRSNWGKSTKSLNLIEEAKKQQYLDLDCYPYTASSTMLLKDFVARADKVLVTWSDKFKNLKINDINKLCKDYNCSVEDLVDKLYPAGAIYFQMSDEDLNRILKFKGTMIGSDGLPGDKHPHPRLWGTFPRVLGRYARDMKLFSLEEAIFKMSGKSSSTFGLKNRGLIKEHYYADIVILDEVNVIDNATYENPLMPSSGIEKVFTNGQLVWSNSEPTSNFSGMFLEGKSFN